MEEAKAAFVTYQLDDLWQVTSLLHTSVSPSVKWQ